MSKSFPAVVLFAFATITAFAADNAIPTFSKEIAPIFNEHCVTCHRPGEAAPMSLRTWTEARPWAKSIRQQVASRVMPPWHAEPGVNHFANDRRLSDAQVSAIIKWVDAGAPEGKRSDLPPVPEFTQGWGIGKPDMVLNTGVDFTIPASGVIPYQYFDIDPGLKEDTWVQAVEVRPGQRSQVHHILVFVRPTAPGAFNLFSLLSPGARGRGGANGPSGATGAPGGPDGPRSQGSPGGPGGAGGFGGRGGPGGRGGSGGPGIEVFSNMLIGYAPGVPTIEWDGETAFLVKAGSHFYFQVHYTANGKETVDRSVLGLKFRKDPPKFRAFSASVLQPRLAIPPNDPNYEVHQTYVFKEDATIVDLTPHMHLRGKAFKYVLTYPDGRSEVLLNVPKYEFDWQLSYVLADPRKVPAGSKLEATAWFDNSVNNKWNPDPSATVHWGDQTFEEMMIGFFNYKVPADRPAAPPAGAR